MARQPEETTSPRHKFHEVFQPKQGRYSELPPSKISEMLKSNSLDNAPTQSLLSVVNGILDESIERKNGEIPDRVACLLRKVVLEIERRISTQAEHIRNQNNLFKTREEKFQSRIRVLETLASGTSDETQMVVNQLQLIKTEKAKIEERKKHEEQDLARLIKEKEDSDLMIAMLKGEIDIKNKSLEQHRMQLETKVREATMGLMKEKEDSDLMVAKLKAEIEVKNKSHEQYCLQFETRVKEATVGLMKEKEYSDLMVAKLKEEIQTVSKSHEQHCLQLEFKAKEARELLMKEKEVSDLMVAKLKEELEVKNKSNEQHSLKSETKVKEAKEELMKEKEAWDLMVKKLREEIKNKDKTYEQHLVQLETKLKEAKEVLEEKKKELEEKKNGAEFLLAESRKRTKELEEFSESRVQKWKMKENVCKKFVGIQLKALQDLRLASVSIKKQVVNTQKGYLEDFTRLRTMFRELAAAAETYDMVLAENRRLYNEVQELKGNIRVYCRIRPFLSGENQKATTVDYIGENGELLIINPGKQGKDGHRMFKFNKVFGLAASQAEVYLDTQPLIRSALDGFNVCIFAYGQTGSGKTYTMSGPNSATEENWGVNYRALNDLFHISQTRRNTFMYEVDVQMVEIYNEQVRDLLSNDVTQKRLGIRNASLPNGLAVPDASVYPVKSTADVFELMQIGQTNRAMSATALNERSSRSHSILTVHIRGTDLKTGASLRGSLHLVDLAGSERVDRSEVTGDRLREAQHINKSLSALGDVISALAQKSSHVPYRNSKLTQVLQSSLGGHAKTLMFVQINPDVESYSETMSTLKFAERVSGVELGAARSSKEGKDVRELMEQVASLKDTVARKDEEIDRLHILRDLKYDTLSHSSSSPILPSLGGTTQQGQNLFGQRSVRPADRIFSNIRNCYKHKDEHSERVLQSTDDFKHQNGISSHSKTLVLDSGELLASATGEAEEKSSSTSGGGLPVGSEMDSLASSADEFPEVDRATDSTKPRVPSQPPRSPTQRARMLSSAQTKLKDSLKTPLSPRRTVTGQTNSSLLKSSKSRWQ